MRIIFMGSPDFAIPSMEKIYQSVHDLVAVVSNVDKRRGRGGKKSPTPVKSWALEHNMPVITVENLKNPDFEQQISDLEPDLLVVVAFRILPDKILKIPKKGSVNLHASLLPKYRGAAPIHWAIMNGEQKTGCTVFFLEQKVDTGAIIGQCETPIGPSETTGDLYQRLKIMGADLLLESVDDIARGDVNPQPQNHQAATPAPKLFREDCILDVSKPAEQVHNKIRGLSPFPAAYTMLDGNKLNIYRSRVGPDLTLRAGNLAVHQNELFLGCGSGTVKLEQVQLQGRKRMSGKDFVNGYDGPMRIDESNCQK